MFCGPLPNVMGIKLWDLLRCACEQGRCESIDSLYTSETLAGFESIGIQHLSTGKPPGRSQLQAALQATEASGLEEPEPLQQSSHHVVSASRAVLEALWLRNSQSPRAAGRRASNLGAKVTGNILPL